MYFRNKTTPELKPVLGVTQSYTHNAGSFQKWDRFRINTVLSSTMSGLYCGLPLYVKLAQIIHVLLIESSLQPMQTMTSLFPSLWQT